jgi:hypothetical protein
MVTQEAIVCLAVHHILKPGGIYFNMLYTEMKRRETKRKRSTHFFLKLKKIVTKIAVYQGFR